MRRGIQVGKVAFTGHKQATTRVSCRAKSQVPQSKPERGASLRTSHLRIRQRGSPTIRRPMRTHPSRRFFFPLLWSNRLNAAPEFLVCRSESEGHCYSAECFDPGRPAKGIGRDIKCHRRACRNHSAFADRQCFPGPTHHQATCGNGSLLFDNYLSGTKGMSDDHRTEPDRSTILGLHGFGKFIFKVNVIADNYLAADFNSPQAMKKRP